MPKVGKCALCLSPNVDLQDSHVVPRWAYQPLRDDRPGRNPEPIMVWDGKALQISKQTSEHMLCVACERRFKVDEDYVYSLVPTALDFPARKLVGKPERGVPADGTAVGVGQLDRDRIAYFGASVVWRGHTAKCVPDCDLAAFAEPFRQYLLDRTVGFPSGTSSELYVVDNGPKWRRACGTISLPQTTQRERQSSSGIPIHHTSHEFVLLGLYFTLRTESSPFLRASLYGNPPTVTLTPPSKFLSWFAPHIVKASPRGKLRPSAAVRGGPKKR